MLDFDAVVELMKKYGYSSTTSHPYIYQYEDTIGICYLYYDEEYGSLERIKTFKDMESFEEFLKQLEWVKVNGISRHVRMILDNYEAREPKTMFLRNEKLMVEGEMFTIEDFDFRESQRQLMDDVSKVIYEAGDLLLVYDEMKGRQLQYLTNIIKLKNSLRQKYFDLQKEIDEYNRHKVDREIKLLPEVADSGINETMEIALKDKYNMYIAERPPYDEACSFLQEVWELCKSLELNIKYYDALKEENDAHNEFKIVNQKMDLMTKLNDEGRPLFGIDLVSHFRKINKVCLSESTSISDEYIHEQCENIELKYSVFDNIDILNTSDYLREAIQNSNYADLAIKYAKGSGEAAAKASRTPLNEVAASLSIQYNSSLTPLEQSILVLYNNHHFRKLCDAILRVEGFESLPFKKLINIISKTKGYSKIKSIVYDALKKRVSDPLNDSIRKSLFSQFDFTTYETFINSVIKSLILLKNINTKMVLSGDINMYVKVDTVEEVKNVRFLNVTNALDNLLGVTKGTDSMIGIVLLKSKTPVLYSPYYLDIGDVYTKGASLQMQIREMIDFELLIDCSDIIINIDPKHTNVVRYYSVPKTVGDLSVVDDIKMSYKTTFCKYAFTSKTAGVVQVPEKQEAIVPVGQPVSQVSGAGAPVANAGMQAPVGVVPPVSQVSVDVKPATQVTPVAPTAPVAPAAPVSSATPVAPVVAPTNATSNPVVNAVPNSAVPPVKPVEKVVEKTIAAPNIKMANQPVVTKVPDTSANKEKIVPVTTTPATTPVVKPAPNVVSGNNLASTTTAGQVHKPQDSQVQKSQQVVVKPVSQAGKPVNSEHKVSEGVKTPSNGEGNKQAISVKPEVTSKPVVSQVKSGETPSKPVSQVGQPVKTDTTKTNVVSKTEDKNKEVAKPLPVPKVVNPNQKKVVVQNVATPLKKPDASDNQNKTSSNEDKK